MNYLNGLIGAFGRAERRESQQQESNSFLLNSQWIFVNLYV
jgi:hypothetical protein